MTGMLRFWQYDASTGIVTLRFSTRKMVPDFVKLSDGRMLQSCHRRRSFRLRPMEKEGRDIGDKPTTVHD